MCIYLPVRVQVIQTTPVRHIPDGIALTKPNNVIVQGQQIDGNEPRCAKCTQIETASDAANCMCRATPATQKPVDRDVEAKTFGKASRRRMEDRA
jgi:hypothetical protein